MPKPTPAMIIYQTEVHASQADFDDAGNGDIVTQSTDNFIRFHSVIFEDHEASSEVTKFPVQSGFEISNHSIRKNRKVKIEAIITNTLLVDTQQVYYSSNNQKTIFNTIEDLVNSSTPCEVVTNLGVYKPVVFTNFRTKQVQGMTDSMLLTLTGEEVQVKETVNKTAPKSLIFEEVPAAERQSVIDELSKSGIGSVGGIGGDLLGSVSDGLEGLTDGLGGIIPDLSGLTGGILESATGLIGDVTDIIGDATGFLSEISPDAIISQATGFLGEDFSFSSILPSGELFDVTYVMDAFDGISDYTYSVFTGNTDVFSGLTDIDSGLLDDINIPLIPSVTDLLGGLDGVTNCLLGGNSSVLTDSIDDFVDTAMGRLDRSIYGAKQDIIKLGGNDSIQSLIGTSLDCVAAGASDVFGTGEATSVDEAVDEAIVRIKGIGNIATGGISGVADVVGGAVRKAVTFTKIETPVKMPLESSGERDTSYFIR